MILTDTIGRFTFTDKFGNEITLFPDAIATISFNKENATMKINGETFEFDKKEADYHEKFYKSYIEHNTRHKFNPLDLMKKLKLIFDKLDTFQTALDNLDDHVIRKFDAVANQLVIDSRKKP
jgi:hypothetical protein